MQSDLLSDRCRLVWSSKDIIAIGGDTLSAGAAIAAPLRIFGQQPIQNAAPTQTMFTIVIEPFCGNWTLRLGPTSNVYYIYITSSSSASTPWAIGDRINRSWSL